jgi:hypothetical protein
MAILHMDNTKSHCSKVIVQKMTELKLTRALHPPFSPEITSSDFYLFGHPKNSSEKGSTTTRKLYFEWDRKFYIEFALGLSNPHPAQSTKAINKEFWPMI